MTAAPVQTDLPDTGVEWPQASVDAPDAYYARVRARILPDRLLIYDRRDGTLMGDYTLKAAPEMYERGVAILYAEGYDMALLVGQERPCNCDKPSTMTAKAAR